MSTGAQVAVLDARGLRRTRTRADSGAPERPRLRIITFAALGFYGALRWGTMLTPAPTGRMLGLLAVAVLLVATGTYFARRSSALVAILIVLGAIAVFPLAGIPFGWVRHIRLAAGADAIGQGLSALPRAFVPYNGINEWVRVVIVLGGGILLLLAALPLALARRPPGELRRAVAALPLVALAIVPSTLARPQVAYLHGLILFALLAAFVWGERVAGSDAPLAVGIAALAGAAAMVAAPALDRHTPWLDYESLAGQLGPGNVEAFDWTQRYGPLNWPRTGREVLDVSAAHPDYWKTENLELFRGSGWEAGSTDPGAAPPPSPRAVARWSQTIHVTLRAMRTDQVIGAGFSGQPVHLPELINPGLAPGTWVAPSGLQPGDSYELTTYSPRPTDAELSRPGAGIPAVALQGQLTIVLPARGEPDQEIVFGTFGSHSAPSNISNFTGIDGAEVIRSSPYADVYALARRLQAHAATPAGYVQRVLTYLHHDFTYSENPPPSRYPLVSFLLKDKAGYCQQFAGAMALLLRMGGVPARVATGFTTGDFDHARHQYVVSDLDAHAWVEAWFPGYGWVRFDPTPATAPARSGRALLPAIRGSAAPIQPIRPVRHGDPVPAQAPVAPVRHAGGAAALPIAVALAALLLIVAVLALSTVRLREPRESELVAELERAMARCGRPLAPGSTLAVLERRFRTAPDAAAYVGTLRRMRFAGGASPPTAAQRRALRAQLRSGLGLLGRVRALWALPPRWHLSLRGGTRGGAYTHQ